MVPWEATCATLPRGPLVAAASKRLLGTLLEDHLRNVALVSLLLLSVLANSPAARADSGPLPSQGNKLLVVDAISFTTTGVPKTVHERERFFATLRKAMGEKGWATIVQPADPSCISGDDCLVAVTQNADAPYALRISGEGNLVRGYTLHLRLYSPATKRSQQATAYCDICATDRMAEIASDFALRLINDAAKEERTTKQDEKRPVASALTPKPEAPAASGIGIVPAPPGPPSSHVVPVLCWSMVGVGVLAMAYGGWALYKNGNSSGNGELSSTQVLARDRYSTTTLGATSLAVGGALALIGAIILMTEPRAATAVSLASSANGLSLRF